MRAIQTVIDTVKSKGYKFFEGQMDPNFICVRESNTYTNAFTDHLYLIYKMGDRTIMHTSRITTKPGLYGNLAVLSNNKSSAGGVTGTASIVPGQYRGLWRMRNLHLLSGGVKCMQGNPHAAPSLHQIGMVEVARDNNKNLVIDSFLPTTKGNWYGINGHYMGYDNTPNNFEDDNLNNWSVGCVGAPAMDWYYIMKILSECSKYTGDSLTLTLLEAKDF